jgi:hypothetical protein
MASTYSTNLALELIGTGDQAGTWGNTTNTNLGTLIEQAISGYVTQAVSTGTDTTITIPNGATGVARNMFIELTGTGGASTNLIVPSNKKLYFIYNNASGAVTVKVAGQTGVSVAAGTKVILVSNGTDIVTATSYVASGGAASFASLTVSTGNLNFSGTGQRITGDFTSTPADRLALQTNVVNSNTNVEIIPNGTATTAGIFVESDSAITNSSNAQLVIVGGGDMRVVSGIRGTGTYLPMSFYTGGSSRMVLDTSGNVGIGGTANAYEKVQIGGTLPTSSNICLGLANRGVVPSGATTAAYGIANGVYTAAASFTLASYYQFYAHDVTKGAGSAITSNYGFYCDALTFGTNNYGFYSNIASGSNRWNFYAAGTAKNYFAGGVEDAAGNLRDIPSAGTSKTSAYTLTVSDVGEFVTVGSGGSITVPNDTFTAGNAISIYNDTTGNISINFSITTAYQAGTNTDKASLTLSTRGIATILFINPSLCVASGNLS